MSRGNDGETSGTGFQDRIRHTLGVAISSHDRMLNVSSRELHLRCNSIVRQTSEQSYGVRQLQRRNQILTDTTKRTVSNYLKLRPGKRLESAMKGQDQEMRCLLFNQTPYEQENRTVLFWRCSSKQLQINSIGHVKNLLSWRPQVEDAPFHITRHHNQCFGQLEQLWITRRTFLKNRIAACIIAMEVHHQGNTKVLARINDLYANRSIFG